MLESSVSKGAKTPRTRARRWLCFLTLFLMVAILMLIFNSSTELSLIFWKTENINNLTTSHVTISSSPSPLPYLVAYPNQYHFILDEPNRCHQESPFLVVIIPVAPQNREARDIIRNTWGSEITVLGQPVSHYFLLGVSKEQDGAQEQVLLESQRHHDILQSDFLDSYNNLTIKTMVMFEWLSTHCPKTSYAMKVDSDMFLNIQNLIGMLLNTPRHLYMTGRVVRDAAVLRDSNSKWFMPFSVFPESSYPPYALGLGYVFSLDLPKKILEASAHVKAVYIEDVYVGLCMRHVGITLTNPPNDGLFRTSVPENTGDCYWTSVITTILQNSQQLVDVWRTYQSQAQSGC
ncbi:beta-1,3-galactosyltransferase 2-like isoform X2 [Parambassis ranga]|uniref:Hexosyltransferase n=1 Tax=Parambassis ranga TaxID=210632 RepID=A0A6P7J7V7_9TELE|nr:beta-1,3-galactosyltransferase 2-like isoform X2 [Parambassis ranga]